jgi:HD-GYP domain-containing protein (c-di-GMP phosphodiesterase class II)
MPAGNKPSVVLVDGVASDRADVKTRLASLYNILDFPNLTDALNYARKNSPDAMLVAEDRSPGKDFHFLTNLRRDALLKTLPIIVILAEANEALHASAIRSGANAVLAKPYLQRELIKRVSGLISDGVENRWNALPPSQADALKSTVAVFNRMSDMIAAGQPVIYSQATAACLPLVAAVNSENFQGILRGVREHDNYTYAHSLRVATFLTIFGANMGLSVDEQKLLATGGVLHDLGKLQIPIHILNKPGRLTKEEFVTMQGHVPSTLQLLEKCENIPKGVLIIAGQHHEKLDGSGYPNGLKGNQLNQLARMTAIVDIFTALTDRRVYKSAMLPEEALAFMSDAMATQLDMQLLAFFREMLLDAAVE